MIFERYTWLNLTLFLIVQYYYRSFK